MARETLHDEATVNEGDGYRLLVSGSYVAVEDYLVPEFIEITVGGHDGQPSTFARIEVRNGAPSCTELRIVSASSEREVRQSDLREIQVSALVEDLVAGFMFRIQESDDGSGIVRVPYVETESYFDALRFAGRLRQAKGNRVITDELLKRVAAVYRENYDDKPTQAVQRRFAVSPRMASTYVQKARAKGFLPPTTAGKKKA